MTPPVQNVAVVAHGRRVQLSLDGSPAIDAVSLPATAHAYCDAVLSLAAVREWMEAARRETEFVLADEPYASR